MYLIAALLIWSSFAGAQGQFTRKEIDEYVNKVFRQDLLSSSGTSYAYAAEESDETASLKKITSNPLLSIVAHQGKFKENQLARNTIQWEAYRDCLFVQKKLREKNIPKKIHLVPEGMAELKLDCADVCVKPKPNQTIDWFFRKHYGTTEQGVLRRENAVILKNGKSLLLKWIHLRDGGVFYCKYEGVVYYENWVHVEALKDVIVIRDLPPLHNLTTSNMTMVNETSEKESTSKSTVATVIANNETKFYETIYNYVFNKDLIIDVPEYGFKITHVWESWGECSDMTLDRRHLKKVRQWIKTQVSTIAERFETRFRGCKVHLDTKASPIVKSKFSQEHDIFRLFENHWLPCRSPFLPKLFRDLFTKAMENNTNIFHAMVHERYCQYACGVTVNATTFYSEIHLKQDLDDEVKLTCPGTNEKDKILWTKDGNEFLAKFAVKIREFRTTDIGKYTCWIDDKPISSIYLELQVNYDIIFSYISAVWDKILAFWQSLW